MKLAVDLDGTLCSWHPLRHELAVPFPERIAAIRSLVAEGHDVWIYTARGSSLGSAEAAEARWGALTRLQLATWEVPHAALLFGKPAFELLIDDRAIAFGSDWVEQVRARTLTRGAFAAPASPHPEAAP